jgi:hypothetical protein
LVTTDFTDITDGNSMNYRQSVEASKEMAGGIPKIPQCQEAAARAASARPISDDDNDDA